MRAGSKSHPRIKGDDLFIFLQRLIVFPARHDRFDEEDYLATIPYAGKKGIQKALLDGLVDYIQEILEEGQSDLLDFLNDDSEEAIFELRFNEEEFVEKMTNYQAGAGETMIPYPSY